ncbi:MAG TPA: hypothetical protein PKI91_13010, partial [Smithella sp.]|nr:hypothetical protein [Smithella sp.]
GGQQFGNQMCADKPGPAYYQSIQFILTGLTFLVEWALQNQKFESFAQLLFCHREERKRRGDLFKDQCLMRLLRCSRNDECLLCKRFSLYSAGIFIKAKVGFNKALARKIRKFDYLDCFHALTSS